MKNSRIAVRFLILFGAAISAGAQDGNPPSISQLLDNTLGNQSPAIDLDGIWEAPVEDGVAHRILRVRIEHQGTKLSLIDIAPNTETTGKKIVDAEYHGQKIFHGVSYDDYGKPDDDVTMTLVDPDTITTESKLVLTRMSAPSPHDIPCESTNRFGVKAAGALARGDVAADAKQYPTALCWAAIAGHLGDAKGQYVVGMFLRRGIATQKDPVRAFKWILLSAEQDFYEAQKAVAEMYARAEGTPYNSEQSMYWLQRASSTYVAERREEVAAALVNFVDSVTASAVKNSEPNAPPRAPQQFCVWKTVALGGRIKVCRPSN